MFQVTTILPDPHDPIAKAKLLDKLKTPKSAEELKQIEDAKKAQKAEEDKEGEGKKKDKKKKKRKKLMRMIYSISLQFLSNNRKLITKKICLENLHF